MDSCLEPRIRGCHPPRSTVPRHPLRFALLATCLSTTACVAGLPLPPPSEAERSSLGVIAACPPPFAHAVEVAGPGGGSRLGPPHICTDVAKLDIPTSGGHGGMAGVAGMAGVGIELGVCLVGWAVWGIATAGESNSPERARQRREQEAIERAVARYGPSRELFDRTLSKAQSLAGLWIRSEVPLDGDKSRAALHRRGVDTVLEIEIKSITVWPSEHTSIAIRAKARLVRAADGETLATTTRCYDDGSRGRPIEELLEAGGSRLMAELDHGLEVLATALVEQLFLLYRPAGGAQ